MIETYFHVLFLILIIGIPLAIIGNLVYWNRMSTIPSSISHSSLMITAFSLVLSLNFYFAAFLFILVGSFIISFARNVLGITNDATSVFNSQISLSISTIVIFVFSSYGDSASFILTGNILLINKIDILIAIILAVCSIIYYLFFYKKLVIIVINRDIAKAEGINVFLHDYLFLIAVSSVVVIGVKLVGILLVGGLLIIPSMSLRLAKIHGMSKAVLYSYFIIVLGAIIGLSCSFYFNIESIGPFISISVIALSLLLYGVRFFIPSK